MILFEQTARITTCTSKARSMIKNKYWFIVPVTLVINVLMVFAFKSLVQMTWHGFPFIGLASGLLSLLIFSLITTPIRPKTFVVKWDQNEFTVVRKFDPEWTHCFKLIYSVWVDAELAERIQSYCSDASCTTISPKSDPRIEFAIHLSHEESPERTVQIMNFLDHYKKKTGSSFSNMVDYIGHEFCKKYDTQLAKFTNPADKEQQQEFRNLVAQFLNEYFEGKPLLHVGMASEFWM